MRNVLLYVFILWLSSSAIGKNAYPRELTVYQSVDGMIELLVSKKYYYLGTSDHPTGSDFLARYGQPIDFHTNGGQSCLSLGVFKIAKFNSSSASCQNVKIRKIPSKYKHGVIYYMASCFELSSRGCSIKIGKGRPALVYGYKFEHGRGVMEIYLSDERSRGVSNTLKLKSGIPLFNQGKLPFPACGTVIHR